jgi:hypothetical protein
VNAVLRRSLLCTVVFVGALLMSRDAANVADATIKTPADLVSAFANEVRPRLFPPDDEIQLYSETLNETLSRADLQIANPQIVAVVDRDPNVQALFIFLASTNATPQLIGATPVSTGRVGAFDHFETPVGIFEHSINNLDFRAEGTKNELGIRGYGIRGMRVFDFGWQPARKGWGDYGLSTMRLQMHATDPALLEPKLGTVQSKGCIRISASANQFIDWYGLLDADYESAILRGSSFWVLHPRRTPTPWSGRYLVVVDSARTERPAWSRPIPLTHQANSAGMRSAKNHPRVDCRSE